MIEALMREIERGSLAPVYLLYGRETFLMEEICGAIEEKVLDGGDPSFNKVVVDLDEVAVQELVREAESPPFRRAADRDRPKRPVFVDGQGKAKGGAPSR